MDISALICSVNTLSISQHKAWHISNSLWLTTVNHAVKAVKQWMNKNKDPTNREISKLVKNTTGEKDIKIIMQADKYRE